MSLLCGSLPGIVMLASLFAPRLPDRALRVVLAATLTLSPAAAQCLMPNSAPSRAWQRMLSGRRLDLLEPSPLDIEIEDIAHGLARVARWNGQTKGAHAFSVAQHSRAGGAAGGRAVSPG